MDAAGESLQAVLVLLACAVLAVVAARSLHLPPMLGYLLTGMVLGPHALALAGDSPAMRHLAEFGVVLHAGGVLGQRQCVGADQHAHHQVAQHGR